PTFVHVTQVDSAANSTAGSTTPTSVVTDSTANTVTATYSWGVATTAYQAVSNRLNITVTIRNTTPDKTISHIWMYPLGIQFPAPPANLNPSASVDFNLDAPSSIWWNYGSGTVDLVNDDVVQPLATGFWPAASLDKSKWFVMLDMDSGQAVTKAWPSI